MKIKMVFFLIAGGALVGSGMSGLIGVTPTISLIIAGVAFSIIGFLEL